MIKKLFNYYVQLYVAEDTKNKKQRIEIRRLLFLIVNLFFLWILCSLILTIFVNFINNIWR